MSTVTLWKNNDITTATTLHRAGNGIVLEIIEGKVTPHYFETNAQAKKFIIEQAYALLSLGYEVHDD